MISLAQFEAINEPYTANNCNGLPTDEPTECRQGTHVVLVAVHAVNHYSGPHPDDLKVADINTGGIVSLLQQRTGCSSIINTFRHASINPHIGRTNAERKLQLLQERHGEIVIIDIHGAKNTSAFDIALGTSCQLNAKQEVLLEVFKKAAGRHGLEMVVNVKDYSAKGSHTITRRSVEVGMESAIQVEIVRRYRDSANMEHVNRLLGFLEEVIEAINSATTDPQSHSKEK